MPCSPALARAVLALLLVAPVLVASAIGTAAPASAGPYGHVTGTVTGPGGIPASTIDVHVMHLDDSGTWTSVGYDSTDREGRFELWAQPGVHRVSFRPYLERSVYLPTYYPAAPTIEAAADVTVTSDSSQVLDVEMHAGPHADLTGTVVGTDGAPVAGAEVQLWVDRGAPGDPWWVNRHLVATDTAGRFHELIQPGSYRISFRRAGYVEVFHDGAPTLEEATEVALEDGGSARLDAVLTRQTLLRGSLLAAGRAAGIPGTRVHLYRNTGTPAAPTWSLAGTADTHWETGAYVKHVAPGDYLVRASDPYGEYRSEYHRLAFSPASATLVPVKAETTVTVPTIHMTRHDATPMTASAAPVVTGAARPGETLSATAGAWSPAPAVTRFQWLADGVAIDGATGATYQPTSEDLGRTLTVRVSAYTPGRSPASQLSAATGPVATTPEEPTATPTPTPTPRTPSTTTLRLVDRGTTVRHVVRVRAEVAAEGKVRVLRAGRLVRTVTLEAGRARLVLRRPPRGTWYQARYLGSDTVAPSSARVRFTG